MHSLLKTLPFLMLLFICGSFSFAQEKTVTWYLDPSSNPPDLQVDLRHIRADVSFVPEKNRVKATILFTLEPRRHTVDSMVFYAPGFEVSEAKLRQKSENSSQMPEIKLNFKSSATRLVVFPEPGKLEKGREYLLTLSYEASPQNGAIYFIGWRPEEEGKRREIWAHRPHGWLPYMDARIRMDMYYTIDSGYRVFANGDRVAVKENNDGTRTWHYRMEKDHPFFSTSLVIGKYNFVTTSTKRGVPLEYWYYEGMRDRVPVTYKYTPQMFDFFEAEMGVNYPYPLYREAPVIDYMYGAMETTTATVFGDYLFIDPHAWWQRNYVNVNAHELAHQWFGNYICHFVNRDVWLTESFGTYYAKMFEKHVFGEDYYQNLRNEEMLLAMEASKRNHYPVGGSQGGVQRIYQKGSLVLDMLRDVMGEREFREAVKTYLLRYGFNYTETGDFIRCTYDVTGQSYQWFFDEWVLRGGEPHYQVKWQEIEDTSGNRNTRVQVWQIHETNDLIGTFRMPIAIEVWYEDGSHDRVTAWMNEKYNEAAIPNPEKKPIGFVLFDPGRKILKKLTFERSFRELATQAEMAPGMIDRYDALLSLRTFPVDQKRDVLIGCYQHEKFHLTKAEIINQLSEDYTPESVEIFREGLKDPDALVRKAVLQNIHPLPDMLAETAETCLYDSSYLNIELALENLCFSFPRNDSLYLARTAGMEGWRGRNIRMKWLEIRLLAGENQYLAEVVGYTGPKYEFETRMNALALLKKLRYIDDTTLTNARSASRHWNNKLAAAGREYLGYFGEN